jgi:drug/metabolite transporter (DMT)-like permease
MGYLLILFTITLFSTLEVTGKLIGSNISPFAITAYRFLIGGLLILPFAIKSIKNRKQKLKFKDFAKLSVAGIINVTFAMLFLQLAVKYGEASISAILVSSNSIFVAIFSSLFFKEKLNKTKIISLILGVFGLTLIILQEHGSTSTASHPVLGIVFGCLAAISFGLYTVISKQYVKQYGNMITNSVSFLIGSFTLITISLFSGFDLTVAFTKSNMLLLSYLGIFVSGIAYLTFFEGLKRVPTTIGSMFFFLKPIIASILAYLLFGEKLTYIQMAGIVIVIIGVNLSVFKNLMDKSKTS